MADITQIREKRILVVEDEVLIGMEISDIFETHGAITYGPIVTKKDAEAIINLYDIDLAILDVNVSDGTINSLVGYLAEQSIPMVFYTGDPNAAEEYGLDDYGPIVDKPSAPSNLVYTAITVLDKKLDLTDIIPD